MSALDRLFYGLSTRPPMEPARRASLVLSSMYSVIDGRADDSLAGNSFWIKQSSWNMLAGAWGIKGRTIAQKHDKAVAVLSWLRDVGDRVDQAGAAEPPDLLAWDVARLVHVARRCRHAGFLGDAEAWQHVLGAGRLARPAFRDWDGYGTAFLRGREVWAGGPDVTVVAAVGKLVHDETSMWRTTPWDDLPA
jgi:hypothetical protein